MDLTAETLLEVLKSLRSDAPAGQMRRRQLPRVGVSLRLMILPCGEPAGSTAGPAVVRLRNLSRHGLGFVHNRPLSLGQSFVITLPREAGGSVQMLGRVERCRPLDGGGSYDIGAAIRTDVPREELDYHLRSLRRSA